jgi:hypothetical protein
MADRSRELVFYQKLTANVLLIDISQIPQDGTDLEIVLESRGAGQNGAVNISLNGDSSISRLNFSSSGGGNSFNNLQFDLRMTQNSISPNTFTNSSIYINNYSSQTFAKGYHASSARPASDNPDRYMTSTLTTGVYNQTIPITSVGIFSEWGELIAAGTEVSVYKIKSTSDGNTLVN